MKPNQKTIYLDYAATTPLHPDVFAAMEPWLKTNYGNPSSAYSLGYHARRAIDDARASVAAYLNCSPHEIIFTSGGTESDNIALFGAARACRQRGDQSNHIVTSTIEHAAVMDSMHALQEEGFECEYMNVESDGVMNPERIAASIKPHTILTSIMMANNEIGTIQPIQQIVAAVKQRNPKTLVHTDACQATGAFTIDVQQLGIDLLTLNAGKIYGPKGVGALYIKNGINLQPIHYGGDQERGIRPGTENVAGIVGFAKALEIAAQDRDTENARQRALRDQLHNGIMQAIPDVEVNGTLEPSKRLPNNLNILLSGVDGEALLFSLDQQGICASLGSACTAGSLEPSHVIMALGRTRQQARQSLRLTLGRYTTQEDIDACVRILPPIVQKLRSL